MRKTYILFVALLSCNLSLAQEPIISHHVVIMQTATPLQCTSTFRGRASQQSYISTSRFGMSYSTEPGVRACTGCALDAAHDCVCETCYDY